VFIQSLDVGNPCATLQSMPRSAADILARNSGTLLFAGGIVVLLFVILVWLIQGHSIASLGSSVQVTLTLLMAMDSPKNALPQTPVWLLALGWLVSLAGWLFFPLLVTQIFDTMLSRQELDSEYAIKLRALGVESGLSGEKLEVFVGRALKAKNLVFAGLKQK